MCLTQLTRLKAIVLLLGVSSFSLSFAVDGNSRVVKIEIASSAHPMMQESLDKLSTRIPTHVNVRPSAELVTATHPETTDIIIAATAHDGLAIRQRYGNKIAAEKDVVSNRFVVISSNKTAPTNSLEKAQWVYSNKKYAEVAKLYLAHMQTNQPVPQLVREENFDKALADPSSTSVIFTTASDWNQNKNKFPYWHITPVRAEHLGGSQDVYYRIFLTQSGASNPNSIEAYRQLGEKN